MNPHVARLEGVEAKERRVVVDNERAAGLLWGVHMREDEQRIEVGMEDRMLNKEGRAMKCGSEEGMGYVYEGRRRRKLGKLMGLVSHRREEALRGPCYAERVSHHPRLDSVGSD